MLLLTECPRTVDMELPVSEEIVESGRGMYSMLSEKPTRGREGFLGGSVSDSEDTGLNVSDNAFGAEMARSSGGTWSEDSMGVLGKLLLRRGSAVTGRTMVLISWFDTAVERRCA